ncbi:MULTISPECIES: VCBS domain-containing protein [Vibrio]|uniref:VCBS domain-containing protein n=1 Tax=Vibrio TaxID=662 RepID=UPI00207500B9|nr:MULTISPECIES: VCBS domain-containing protein [Vibrio]USD34168.1 VCBS domain-containing protein [Vibrio sp. SCSIO 43186]USD47239.1 VCBS domain-containing protein [Vibrio sp. SCSIO 43145]USD71292.1 VCBS domain-containing protein [Vibrio sp. SCSIO 43139]USD98205.1 hypothetical protein CTT30_19400 [Vibrio coralliilyticus]
MATNDKKDRKSNANVNKEEAPSKNKTAASKVRLFSRLNIKVPLPREIAMILPSLMLSKETDNVSNESHTGEQPYDSSSVVKNETVQTSHDTPNTPAPKASLKSEEAVAEMEEKGHLQDSLSVTPSHHLSTKQHPLVHQITNHVPHTDTPNTVTTKPSTPLQTPALTSQSQITYIDETMKGKYGSLHINSDGSYTFTLDPKSPAYIALQKQEPGTDTFTVHLSNGTDVVIQVPVQGHQDSPSISGDLRGSVIEDRNVDSHGLITTSGKIDVIDPDHDESAVQAETLKGKFGTLTIDAQGHWQYQVNNSQSNIQALTSQTELHESFTIHTKDGTSQVVNMSIGGTDDHASISGGFGSITEDKQTFVSGQLSIQDPDANQDYFIAGQQAGVYGALEFNKDGSWRYILDNNKAAVQYLNQSEHHQEVFTIQSAAGTRHSITIKVEGSNDVPTLSAQSHAVTEDGKRLTGQMQGHDIDHGATLTYSIAQPIDGLTFNPDGSYSFDPTNAAYQHLTSGQKDTLTIPVTVTDEHGASATQNLEIVITGANDAAKVTGVDTGNVHENQAGQDMSPDYAQPGMSKISHDALYASGQLSIADLDAGEAKFDTKGGIYSYHGQYGHLLLREDGHWDYKVAAGQTDWLRQGATTTVGTTIDKLGAGETLTDTITIQTKDGTTHDIVITIHGDNDAPYVSSEVQLNSGKEDIAQTITAADLLANTIDVDHNDQGQLSIANLIADHGSIKDNQDGTYTFTPDKDYNGQVHFTYDVKDAHSGVTHTGANMTLAPVGDAATITGTDTGSITEDKHVLPDSMHRIQVVGSLSVSDPDAGEDHFKASGAFGHERAISDPFQGEMHIDRHGNWDYVLANGNPAVQALKQGETKDVIYEVHSADGTPHRITITVTGTDDAPTVSSSVTLTAGKEDTVVTLQASDLLAHASDIDHDAQLSIHNLSVDHGQVIDNHDGTFRFTPDKDYTGPVQFSYQIQDEHGASVQQTASMNLAPQDDAAVFSGQDTGNVTEDYKPYSAVNGNYAFTIQAQGSLTATDPDLNESGFEFKTLVTSSLHPEWAPYTSSLGGKLEITPDGSWSYYIDNRKPEVQQLGKDETLTDTVTVHSKDGTTHDIVITIHGTNDAPTISSEVQLNSGKEDIAQTITATELLANAIDVDHNDQGQLSIANLVADHGSIKDNHDGTYTFTPDKDYNGQVHFTYDVKDAHSGVTHTGATMTLAPVGDAATITGTDTGSITEDKHVLPDSMHRIQVVGSLSVSDPDAGEDHFRTSGAFGHERAISDPFQGEMHIDRHGNWDYVLANGNPAVQALKQGETKDVIYEVHSADGTPHRITITVTGTNDAPTVSSSVTLAAGKEDTAVTLQASDLLAHASDIDHDAQLSIHSLSADHGQVTDNHDGTFRFTPDKDYTGPVQFSYQVQDEHGASVQQTASMNLAAVNDAATIGGKDTGDVTEDRNLASSVSGLAGQLDTYGTLTVTDPDAGQSEFDAKLLANSYHTQLGGRLYINDRGDWGYSIDNSKPAIQQLGQGETLTDTVTVHSKDGTTHDIVITIHGDNDAPYVSSEVQLNSGKEDIAQTITVRELLANAVDVDHNDQGQLSIANLVADHGSVKDNHDGTYTFTPDKDYNGQVHFTYDVKDTNGGEVRTGASTTLLPTNDAAVFSGQDTGDVTEDYKPNASVVGNYSYTIQAHGMLTATDSDLGESGFEFNTLISVPMHPEWAPYTSSLGGKLEIGPKGDWGYYIDNRKPEIQQLGENETLTDTVTVHSKDGTTHDIVITIHGTNDAPAVSSEVQLNSGKEGTVQTITASDLLANASDIDSNDKGQLSVDNLVADHGSIRDNQDGTYTFTPNKGYNGQVHFTYNVQDAHSGATHASASMTLTSLAPTPVSQSDETVDQQVPTVDVILSPDEVTDEQTAPPTGEGNSHHGAAAYLSALGLNSEQASTETSTPTPSELPNDIDIVLTEGEHTELQEQAVDTDMLEPKHDQTDDSDNKHQDLINPDEHHDHTDPSHLIDPY